MPTLLYAVRFCLVLLLALTSLSATANAAEPVKPAALQPGDTIAFVAPAGELDRERMERAEGRLTERGFKIVYADDLYRVRGYLAGSDERRAEELMQAFRDPQVKAIFPGTGGYGTMRMMDLLDYEVIQQNPKILIGFSDITGLHLAIAAKCNLVTFHSPVPMWGLGSEKNLTPFSNYYFWRCLLASENQTPGGFRYESLEKIGPYERMRPGKATGPLVGGNLTLIASLCGTPYLPSTDGKVLLLEDTHEAPYRIDRMLRQLKLAGVLDRPAAVLLGQFNKCDTQGKNDDGEPDTTPTLGLYDVFNDYFGDAPYPVIHNFPAGHSPFNATMPIGVMCEVDAEAEVVRLLENPVTAD